jgi:hypothetical protein
MNSFYSGQRMIRPGNSGMILKPDSWQKIRKSAANAYLERQPG